MALERLHKVLARAGFGSRRACEQLIAAGEVEVDGRVVTEMGVQVDAERQRIRCAGRAVRMPERVVLLFNKPRRVVTTLKDNLGRRTVVDYLRSLRTRVVPAGRLDADSQGMLVLTNDGELVNRLTHPRYGVAKTYHVVLRGRLEPPVIERLRRGVWLSDGRTGPLEILVKKRDRTMTVCEVTVREGMNREVRRIFARFRLRVKRLRRIRIGKLGLGALPEGHYRVLAPEEVELLLAGSRAQSPAAGPAPARSRAVRTRDEEE